MMIEQVMEVVCPTIGLDLVASLSDTAHKLSFGSNMCILAKNATFKFGPVKRRFS